MIDQRIIKRNKGHLHGYQEWYYYDKLWTRGLYKHDLSIGYHEYHDEYHNEATRFYIR